MDVGLYRCGILMIREQRAFACDCIFRHSKQNLVVTRVDLILDSLSPGSSLGWNSYYTTFLSAIPMQLTKRWVDSSPSLPSECGSETSPPRFLRCWTCRRISTAMQGKDELPLVSVVRDELVVHHTVFRIVSSSTVPHMVVMTFGKRCCGWVIVCY